MIESMSIYKSEGIEVMLVTRGHTLDTVLEAMENVIKAQGYNLDGYLDIVEMEG